jgi:hypothetical protein
MFTDAIIYLAIAGVYATLARQARAEGHGWRCYAVLAAGHLVLAASKAVAGH